MSNLTLRQETKQLDLVIQKQKRCNEFIVKCNMELDELVQAHKGRSGRYNNNYTLHAMHFLLILVWKFLALINQFELIINY